MSTQQHNIDSSLNNLPEINARKSASIGSIGIIGNEKGKEELIPLGTDDTYVQYNAPIDKHGDTWGGGIPGYNHEYR